jgi:hypothetical protein
VAPKGGSPPWPLATDQDDQFNCRLQLPLDKKWGNVTASRCSCRHAPATASHALRPSPLARDRRRARFQLTKGLFRYAPVPGRASEEAASRAWPLTAGSRRPNGNWGRDLRQWKRTKPSLLRRISGPLWSSWATTRCQRPRRLYLGWDEGTLTRYLNGTWRLPSARADELEAFLVSPEADLFAIRCLPKRQR